MLEMMFAGRLTVTEVMLYTGWFDDEWNLQEGMDLKVLDDFVG
jgi:hypothetical protein